MRKQLRRIQHLTLIGTLCFAALGPATLANGQTYDVVIRNGRVLDPESGLDGIRNVGITGNRIAAISTAALSGKTLVDATGLVVAPGFIDLHSHGQDAENYRFKAMDGVTTALELEVGVWPVRSGTPRAKERRSSTLERAAATSPHA